MNKADKSRMLYLLDNHYSYYMNYINAGDIENATKQFTYYSGVKTGYENLLLFAHEYIQLNSDGTHCIVQYPYDFNVNAKRENNMKKQVL